MQIYIHVPPWQSKVNFIDRKGFVVGWSDDQSCCEHHGWGFTYSIPKTAEELPPVLKLDQKAKEVLSSYNFVDEEPTRIDAAQLKEEDGGVVCFRCTCWRKDLNNPDIYLVLYNFHNGYYAHGFSFGKLAEHSL